MNTNKRLRVAVTGASGQIGYALLFRIASGQMFGPDTDLELQLIELEVALPSLNGVAMELDDCAFPLLKKVSCTTDLHRGFEGADWSILLGSAPRKAGMERKDLLKINGGIFKDQGQAIDKYAAQNGKVFVVGNPCNTNCLIAMNYAPRLPKENFFAMTMLDQNRAKTQLAQKAGVEISAIKNMIIWGNHSATQYPDFNNTRIGNKKVPQVIHRCQMVKRRNLSALFKNGERRSLKREEHLPPPLPPMLSLTVFTT